MCSALVAVEPGAVASIYGVNLKILKDSSLYVVGEMVSKIFPFLLLPYLTRVLGTEEYGKLAYLMTLVTLFNIFVSMIQFDALSRYYFYYGKRNISAILQSGLLISLFVFLFFSLYFILTKNYTFISLLFIAFAQSLMQIRVTLLQCQKKVLNYITSQLSSAVISTLATIVMFLLFNATAMIRMYCIGFGYLIAAFYAAQYIRIYKVKLTKKKFILGSKYILFFCWPLIIHHLAYYAKGQYDRIFVANFFSNASLGMYSAGLQIALILPVIQMAVAKGLLPYYYEYIKKGKATTKFIMLSMLSASIISIIPSGISALLPEQFFSFVLGSDFMGSKYFCTMFLLGYGFNSGYLVISNYLFYHGKNKLVVALNILSSAVYIMMLYIYGKKSIALIPYATIVSNILLLLSIITLYFMIERQKR